MFPRPADPVRPWTRSRPDERPPLSRTRLRVITSFDIVLALLALVAVVVEALRWTDQAPDLRPVAIGALVALPWLVRNSIPISSGSYSPTIALAPAVLYASEVVGSTSIYPLWAVVTFGTYLFIGHHATIRNPHIAIQLLAGWALVEVAGHTDSVHPPFGRLFTGLVACLLVIALLELVRHRLRFDNWTPPISVPHLLASVTALIGASCGAAILRWMQPLSDGLQSGSKDGSYLSGSLVVMGLVLFTAATLISVLERHLVTIATLTEAAVAMPWPSTEIDNVLVRMSKHGVRARTAELRAEPGGKHSISVELRDGRHLVLVRGRGDIGFRRSERRLAQALVAMAETSRAQAAHEEVLHQAAHTDPLSGLWTFDFFRTCVTTALVEQAPGSRIAILFFNIRNFKQLNKSLGHLKADAVLQELGARLLTRLPIEAFPSRFGGDEFVILFRDVHSSSHVESLRDQVAALVSEHITVEDEIIQVTCTIGTAMSTDTDDVKTLVHRAASSMRQMKASRSSLPEPRWAPEALVLSALFDHGTIDIALQPLVDLRDDTLHGYEVLLRAHHPDFGPLSPVQTIESAIKLGILDELTETIAEQAFTAITQIIEKVGHDLSLSINIEYQQLQDDSALLDWICRRAAETGISVVLELSERKIGDWHSVHDHVAQNLRHRGIALALDDFGAGNATFGVLSYWQWDWVKIDRAFLSDMGERGRSMLPHVVEMLDELRTAAVLEGIETREQLQLARDLGITLAQGYRLGTPQTPAEVLASPVIHGLATDALLDD